MEKMFRVMAVVVVTLSLCVSQASAGLVAHYELDNDCGTRTGTYSLPSGTQPIADPGDVMDGAWDSPGSMYFDGTVTASSFDWGGSFPDDEFTVEGYVKVDSAGPNGWQPLFANYQYLTGWDTFANKMDDDTFNLMFTVNASSRTWTGVLNTDQWYHFAWTYSDGGGSSSVVKCYIDGALVLTSTLAAFDYTSYTVIYMGNCWFFGPPFEGNLDELKVSSGILPTDKLLCNAYTHYELDSIDTYWNGLAPTVGNVALTGGTLPIVDAGDVMIDPIDNPGAVSGANPASMLFAGSAGPAGYDWNMTSPDDEFTIEGFVKVDSTGLNGWQPVYANNSYLTGFEVFVNKIDADTFTFNFGSSGSRAWTGGFNTDQWYHFAWTYSDGGGAVAAVQCYVDGAPVGTTPTLLGASEYPGYSYVTMGWAWYMGPPFAGNIDELRIVPRVLTAGDMMFDPTANHAPTAVAAATVSVDVDPNTLNITSKGRWVTAYLSVELVDDSYDVDGDSLTAAWDFDLSTVDAADITLNGVPGERAEMDGDVLMVKFDRAAVAATVEVGPDVEMELDAGDATLTVSDGELTSEATVAITGTDLIDVIAGGRNGSKGKSQF